MLFWGKGKGAKGDAGKAAAGKAAAGKPAEAQPEATGGTQDAAEHQSAGSVVREFVYGMAAHDMTRYALKTRSSMEHLFILITMGDLLGVPILPPYYSLRLLPYVVPQIATWKRRMLREKDITDALF